MTAVMAAADDAGAVDAVVYGCGWCVCAGVGLGWSYSMTSRLDWL